MIGKSMAFGPGSAARVSHNYSGTKAARRLEPVTKVGVIAVRFFKFMRILASSSIRLLQQTPTQLARHSFRKPSNLRSLTQPKPVIINRMNLTTGASADEILSLDNIRSQLIRLEDTIIFRESARGSGA